MKTKPEQVSIIRGTRGISSMLMEEEKNNNMNAQIHVLYEY